MGNATSGFAYDIGEGSSYYDSLQHYWKLHKGSRKADGQEVTIFRMEKSAVTRSQLEAGQHGFQKIKGIRHPCILQYVDGADLDKELVMVTEPVRPVGEWLQTVSCGDRAAEERIAWGIRCVLSALDFLSSAQGLTHGGVANISIFVTKGGDWKLGGFDYICEWKEGGRDVLHFQTHESLLPQQYRAPERQTKQLAAMLQGPAGAMDIWAVGVLLNDMLAHAATGALASLQRRILLDTPTSRPTASQLLRHSYFTGKELVQLLSFLEAYPVKDDQEKVNFFMQLGHAQQQGRLPSEVAIYKLLPFCRDYVYTDAQQSPTNPALRQLIMSALPVTLETVKSLDPEPFQRLAEPVLLDLFGVNDRGIRALLLQSLDSLSPKMSDASINGKVFESVLGALGDNAPQLRELTLKSILCLVDKLSEKNTNDRLLRSLTKLQADPEASIRTNTTIFLGRIAPRLKEGIRVRMLLPAVLKACRDPFPHARLAGLRAAGACASSFDPLTAASKVLPTVAVLLVDSETVVRDAAFACHDSLMKILVAHSKKLKEEEDKRIKELPEQPVKVQQQDSTGGLSVGSASSAGSFGVVGMGMRAVGASASPHHPVGPATNGRRPVQVDDGWEDDDDYFDAMQQQLDGNKLKEGKSDGWGDEGWGDIDDEMSKGSVVSNGTSRATPGTAAQPGGAERSAIKLVTAGLKTAPLSADDLMSMLDQPPPSQQAPLSTGQSSSVSGGSLLRTSSSQSSAASTGRPMGAEGEKPVKKPQRLQAKRLQVSRQEWDDF